MVFPPWEEFEAVIPCAELLRRVISNRSANRPAKRVSLFPIGLSEGDGRDNQAFTIARYFRDHRIERDATMDILRLWDGQQHGPLGERLLLQKIESAYSRAVGEDQVNIEREQIMTPGELALEYSTYIKKLKRGKVTLG